MKVVVADDEERVCSLICALIDWRRMGLTLCAKAYDGISALTLINEHKPDLVITDIRMPGLDGLDLIRKAKEIQPNLQFIIISGHKQFDYAQTAIKYGVAEYLLKPIKKLELEQTLNKMIAFHAEQQASFQATQQLQQQVTQDRRHKRSLACSLLIQEGRTNLLSTCFSPSALMRVFVIKMDLLQGFHAQCSDSILEAKVEEYVSREFSPFCSDMVTSVFDGCIYLVLSYAESQKAMVLSGSESLLQFLKTQSEIFGTILFTLGLGMEVTTYEKLADSVLSSQQAVAQRLVAGNLKRYVSSGCEEVHSEPVIKSFVLGLQSICAQNSASALQSHCSSFLADLDVMKRSPYAKFKYIMDCFDAGSRFVVDHMTDRTSSDAILREKWLRLENAYSMTLLEEAFAACMQEVFDLYLEEKEENLSKPIRKAQEYMSRHFCDELISLEAVSEAVNLNSSYFSSLFKKNCNKGFFEYLLDLRITEAKRLLANSDFTIAEIAQKVGYRDPKHFSRIFKKAAQIKPNEYRKLYG